MATYDKETCMDIIKRNGEPLPGDLKIAVRIVSYENQWGGDSWAAIYEGEDLGRYHASPACRNVKVVWDRNGN